MKVKFTHILLEPTSVAHPAAPFAASALDQMLNDIVAHGPEIAQELAIDRFQCELDRFSRVAYPHRSLQRNSSLALTMHHLLWDQTLDLIERSQALLQALAQLCQEQPTPEAHARTLECRPLD